MLRTRSTLHSSLAPLSKVASLPDDESMIRRVLWEPAEDFGGGGDGGRAVSIHEVRVAKVTAPPLVYPSLAVLP